MKVFYELIWMIMVMRDYSDQKSSKLIEIEWMSFLLLT